jgi:hypothetical protein
VSSTFRLKPHQLFIFSVLSLFILILFFHISLAYTAQVTLAWDPNTDLELAGYRIYYGSLSDQYSSSVDVGNQTSYTLSNLPDGKTYYFAATAYDREGYESDFSNEVVFNAPPPCTYSISPVSQSFGPEGGASTVNVTATSGCNWTAVSNASWLVITSNSSVTGNGTVNYSALSNSSASMRTGTLTVAGQSVTVTQSGVPQYTLTITKAGTGSGTVTNNPTGTTFSAGTVVTLTATPDANSTFAGWSGGYSGTSLTCTVTMNVNTSVTATFTLKTYTITASAGANGSVSPSGAVTINHGANQTFTITPNSGYNINDVKVDGVSVGKVSSYTFTNVTANHTLDASFNAIPSYTLAITKGGTGSGTVTNNPTGTTFNAGTVVTLTATPDANSTFTGWSGGYSGTSSTCTVTMNGNTSVTATFTLKTYTITASAGANGSVSPSGAVTINHGANQTFTITPNTGYSTADVKVDGVSVGKVSSYTFTNVTANHTLDASFNAIPSYTLAITKGGRGSGVVTNNPTGTTFGADTVVTLTATPDANSTFTGWSGGYSGTSLTCSVTMNGNTSITATFTLKTYTITASAGSNGSISPQGGVAVNYGGSQTFTITPNQYYRVADVKVDGVSQGPITSYTFNNVTSNHSISATFVRKGSRWW